MLKKFFNSTRFRTVDFILFLFTIVVFINITDEILKIAYSVNPSKAYIVIIFVLLLFTAILKFYSGSGMNSLSFYYGSIYERYSLVKRFGKFHFICNVKGVDVAFYTISNSVYFIPADIENFDPVKWLEVENHINKIIYHTTDINSIKSAICSDNS